MKTKICSKCNKDKFLDCFYKDKRLNDGLYSYCKKCHSKLYYQPTGGGGNKKTPIWREHLRKRENWGKKSIIKVGKLNYIIIYFGNGRKKYEHRAIFEQYLGRKLLSSEVVHHINGDTTDNRIENLQLFNSVGEHLKYHRSLTFRFTN